MFFFEHIPWQKLSYEILSKNRRKSNKLSPSWSNVGFLFFAVFSQCNQFLLALGVTIPRQSALSGVWELFSGWGWFETFNFFFSQDTLSRGLPTTGWSDLGECRNWQLRLTGFAFASASQWPLPWAMLASSLMVFRFVALWQNWPQSLCCPPPLGTTLHLSPSPLQHLSGWHSAAFFYFRLLHVRWLPPTGTVSSTMKTRWRDLEQRSSSGRRNFRWESELLAKVCLRFPILVCVQWAWFRMGWVDSSLNECCWVESSLGFQLW